MTHRLSIDGPCVQVVSEEGRFSWQVLGATGVCLERSGQDWSTVRSARRSAAKAHQSLPVVTDVRP